MIQIGSAAFLGASVERYRLANGLEVLFRQDLDCPVFSYQTWIAAGGADDPAGASGIAHLLEHMMFKETTTLPEGEFSARLEAAGAPDVNAWTWNDETVYLQSLPKGNLDLVAGLEADRLANLNLTESALATELDVVMNERASTVEADPLAVLNEKLWETAFTTHPYRRPVIGWRRDLEGVTLDHCLEFYETFYSPSNVKLIIAGHVDRDEMKRTITKHYAGLAARPVRRAARVDEPTQTAYRTEELAVDAETETLMLGVRVPAAAHDDIPALVLIDRVLFGGRSGRLYRRLVDAGIATNVQAYLPQFASSGIYDITVILRPGKRARDAERIVEKAFQRLAAEPVPQDELDRARNKAKAGVYADFKETRGVGEYLGLFEVATGSFESGPRQLAALDRVDPDRLRAVAARYLVREGTTAIVGVPRNATAPIGSAPTASDAGSHGDAAGAPTGRRSYRRVYRRFYWRDPEATETAGGGRHFVVREPSLPLAQFKAVFDAGTTLDPEGKEGLAYLTARMLARGAGDRPKAAFLDEVEGLGASLDAMAGFERIEIGGETLAETWPAYAALVRDAVSAPRFDAEDFEKLKAETRAHLVDALNHDPVLATIHHERELFRGHRYGRPSLGTPETLARIERDDVVAFHRRHVRERGAVAGASGAIATDETRRWIESVFGALPSDGDPGVPTSVASIPPTAPRGRRVLLVDKPRREQTQVRIGHHGLTLDHPDYPLVELANAAFGGASYQSTLFLEIREKRGWSYDVGSAFKVAKTPHSFTLGFSPSARDVASAITLALDLFGQAVRDPIDSASFDFFRSFVLNSAAFDEDTADKRLAIAIDQAVFGFRRAAYLDAIRHATPDAVRDAASRHWFPSDVLITVLGTASELEAKLAKIPGVTDVEVRAYDQIG